MSDDICGSTDTKTDEPCQNPAGLGTNSDIGPCHLHPAMGRPSKFNSERARQAIEAAKEGLSESGCGRAAGVSHTTIQRWKEKDHQYTDEDGTRRDFRAAFRRARNRGERQLVERGLYDPDTDTSMARFLLASSFGYQKSERREHEHAGSGGGPLEISIKREVIDVVDN